MPNGSGGGPPQTTAHDRAKRAAARILVALGLRDRPEHAEVVVTEHDPLVGLGVDVAEFVATRLEEHQRMLKGKKP